MQLRAGNLGVLISELPLILAVSDRFRAGGHVYLQHTWLCKLAWTHHQTWTYLACKLSLRERRHLSTWGEKKKTKKKPTCLESGCYRNKKSQSQNRQLCGLSQLWDIYSLFQLQPQIIIIWIEGLLQRLYLFHHLKVKLTKYSLKLPGMQWVTWAISFSLWCRQYPMQCL